MCFATMALVAGVAGAGVSAYGTLQAGQAQAAAARYQAQVAENNKIIANQNAEYAIKAGIAKSEAESLKGAAIGARIKAAQAANGIDVNTGSAVDVQESQRETSKLDTENVMQDANLQAYGYRTSATNFGAEAGLDRAKADQAITGSELGAAGGILGSASSLGFKWSTMGNSTSTT